MHQRPADAETALGRWHSEDAWVRPDVRALPARRSQTKWPTHQSPLEGFAKDTGRDFPANIVRGYVCCQGDGSNDAALQASRGLYRYSRPDKRYIMWLYRIHWLVRKSNVAARKVDPGVRVCRRQRKVWYLVASMQDLPTIRTSPPQKYQE